MDNELDFEPMWDYCLIKPIEQKATKGGIQLPDGTTLDGVKKARVIKAGKGTYRESGAFIENPIKPGDVIYMMAYVKPFVVTLGGETYLCLSGRDIVATAPNSRQ